MVWFVSCARFTIGAKVYTSLSAYRQSFVIQGEWLFPLFLRYSCWSMTTASCASLFPKRGIFFTQLFTSVDVDAGSKPYFSKAYVSRLGVYWSGESLLLKIPHSGYLMEFSDSDTGSINLSNPLSEGTDAQIVVIPKSISKVTQAEIIHRCHSESDNR